eukprot:3026232-Alexandrium_andersonii.AAC.1
MLFRTSNRGSQVSGQARTARRCCGGGAAAPLVSPAPLRGAGCPCVGPRIGARRFPAKRGLHGA